MILRTCSRAYQQYTQQQYTQHGATFSHIIQPSEFQKNLIRPPPILDICHASRRTFSARPARCSHGRAPRVPYQGPGAEWVSGIRRHEERRAALLRTFGPLSANAKKSHADIVAGKRDVLDVLKTVGAQDPNFTETVRICLLAELERLKLYTRKQRVRMLTTEGKSLARTILSAIWADVRLWYPIMTYDEKVANALCYFAVAEGLESIVKQWLMVDDPQLGEIEGRTPELWRSLTLGHLVTSHLVLATNNSADPAVHCFFEVQDLAKRPKRDELLIAERHPITRISAWNATSKLLQNFGSGQLRSTSEHVYDRFEKFCKVYPKMRTFPKQGAFDTAILRLQHPKRPSFEEMLNFFREHANEARPEQFWDMLKCSKQVLSESLDRTEQLLRAHRSSANADWIAQIRPLLLAARNDPKKYELI